MKRWAVMAFVLMSAASAAAQQVPITGQLQMRDGSPAAAVRMVVIQAPSISIRPSDGQNYFATQAPFRVALTNDAGRFEFPNIPPGRYFILAGVTAHPTYYPATTELEDAGVVTVAAGVAPPPLNFKLLTNPGSRVRGKVSSPPRAGEPERAVLSGVNLGELIETPVRDDGTFEFGRIPSGSYLMSLFPEPSGVRSVPFRIAEQDVTGIEIVRPPVHTVSGRIVVEKGPLPRSFLAFYTPIGAVSSPVRPDGTFTARLHSATHTAELGGLPVGYAITSVRQGTQDVTGKGFTVGAADISDLVINVRAPRQLPFFKGRITGASAIPAGARVTVTGPIITAAEVPLAADGSFQFAALPPGLYRISVPQLPAFTPRNVVVDSAGRDIQLPVNGR